VISDQVDLIPLTKCYFQQNVQKYFYLYDNVITLGHTKPDHNNQIKPQTGLLKLYKSYNII
jgi:hypothetical protein